LEYNLIPTHAYGLQFVVASNRLLHAVHAIPATETMLGHAIWKTKMRPKINVVDILDSDKEKPEHDEQVNDAKV